MKKLTAALLASALIIVPLRTRAQDKPSALRSEVESQFRGMADALKKGDAIGAARYYADDAQVRMARTVVASGRKAIDAYFKSVGVTQDWKLEITEVGGPSDQPWVAGRSTLIYGAKPVTSVVDFLVVMKRQKDGKLRIILDYYHPAR